MEKKTLIRRSDELADADEWGTEALDVNRELVEIDPGAAAARFRLARCLEEAGDVLAARTAFERYLASAPNGLERRVAQRHVAILEERARALATPSVHGALARGRKHARKGDLSRARVWYERAEETATRPTERAQALTGQAYVLRAERRLADAVRTAERATAAHPSRSDNMPAFALLVAVLADLGRLETAREEADLLLEAKPRNRIANAAAGRVYSELEARATRPTARWRAAASRRRGAADERCGRGLVLPSRRSRDEVLEIFEASADIKAWTFLSSLSSLRAMKRKMTPEEWARFKTDAEAASSNCATSSRAGAPSSRPSAPRSLAPLRPRALTKGRVSAGSAVG